MGSSAYKSTQRRSRCTKLLKGRVQLEYPVFYDGINDRVCAPSRPANPMGPLLRTARAEFNMHVMASPARTVCLRQCSTALRARCGRLRSFDPMIAVLRGPLGFRPCVILMTVDITDLARRVVVEAYATNFAPPSGLMARDCGCSRCFFGSRPIHYQDGVKTGDGMTRGSAYTDDLPRRRRW